MGGDVPTDLYWSIVDTAWGHVTVAARGARLTYVGFPEATTDAAVHSLAVHAGVVGPFDVERLMWAEEIIRQYFAGDRVDWQAVPVLLDGSELQLRVWEATRSIPWGQTMTYGEVALAAGYPRAARAAGSALAATASGLLVPCHRVVAANGLGGYGSRPERKLALLRLEGAKVVAVGRSNGRPPRGSVPFTGRRRYWSRPTRCRRSTGRTRCGSDYW